MYFPPEIGRYDQPLIDGIPRAAWDYLAELTRPPKAGADLGVGVLCELYLEWAESEVSTGRMSQGQYKGHRSRLALFTAYPGIEVALVASLSIDLVHEFFEALRPDYSGHYVAGVGRSVRACFRWGARPLPGRTPPRLLDANPLEGYEFPRAPGAVRGYVESAVVRRFYRWAWARARRHGVEAVRRRFDRLFILMLWFQGFTGCRPGEACGLLWDDIRWDSGRIVIPWRRIKTRRKVQRDRIIHLTPPVVRLLRAIERLPGRHPTHVFTHQRVRNATLVADHGPLAGQPWPSGSSASQKLADLRAEAIEAKLKGIVDVGPTKLVAYVHRHAYVSDAVSEGLTHEQAASLVGNTAAVIAQVYAHAIEQKDAERARRLMERGRR
jgi:integrase